MQDPNQGNYAEKYPAIAANLATAKDPEKAYTPPAPTGTPEWVTKLKAKKEGRPWDVRIVQMALDLFDYGDGAMWCDGYEGVGFDQYGEKEGTTAWQAPFWREAWVDAMPNGEYQLVTDKVCAIGSIQLFIGGGDDNADYNTIIERLNVISRDLHNSDSIIGVNDGMGREAVQAVMKEYVARHGGEEGQILPDYKPLVRFDKPKTEDESE